MEPKTSGGSASASALKIPLRIIMKIFLFFKMFSHLRRPFAITSGVILVSLFLIPAHAAGPASPPMLNVEVIHSRDVYNRGGSFPLLFRLHIKDALYIHGPREMGEGILPTVIKFPGSQGVRIVNIGFPLPEKKKFDYEDKALEVYEGVIPVTAELVIDDEASPGRLELNGFVTYQACTDKACFPPERMGIPIVVEIVEENTPGKTLNEELFTRGYAMGGRPGKTPSGIDAGAGLWLTLLGLFLGGLALNLTPCIYPLIPITVSYFGGRSPGAKGRAVIHGVFYVAGIALTNSLLGVVSSLSGGMFGSVMQSPFVLVGVALVLGFLGLSFFGLWELNLPSGLTKMASKNFSGYSGTFFVGLTLGIVAAPCLGPFILGLLTYVAQKGDPYMGFLYFFVLSVGMGLPLSILAVFSGSLDKLPVSGEWMVWVRKVFGWILFAMAFYMIGPLLPGDFVKAVFLAAVLTAAGIHLGFLEGSRSGWKGFSYVKMVVGLAFLGGALFFVAGAYESGDGVKWVPYSGDILQEAEAKNRPVMLDFYAEWCGPCRAMERGVFQNAKVIELSRAVIPVRVDLTRKQPYQEELMENYNVKGVPTIIFLNRHGIEERDLRITSFDEGETVRRNLMRITEGDSL